jgi:Tol biopolymer transport system component/DNA-binding winged helix-turn-helix (wHTH) protein
LPPSHPDPGLDAGFMLGDWQVDVGTNRLLRGDEVRPLRHKAMELLLMLARHAGRTVTREEIEQAIWDGNQFVAPKAINTAVWTIRQALGDDPEAPRYLETIAKKGYRLIAPVRALADFEVPLTSQVMPTAASPVLPSVPPPARRWGRWPALLGAAAAAGLAWAWWVWGDAGAPAPAAAPVPVSAAAAPEALTQEPGVEYLGAISPDGSRLAFAWWRGRGVGELHLRRLAAPPAEHEPLASGLGDVTSVAWSADGQTLAFTTLRGGGRCSLWILALPAAGVDRPAPREIAPCAALATPIMAWSPDGQRIAFSAERDAAGGLFSIAPDGSGLQRLSTAPPTAMADHQPAWSPDGRLLAFVREDPANGTRDFYELSPGQEPVRLTTLKLRFVHGLTHAANGRDLVFSTTRQDSRVLMRWDRASGQLVPLGLEGSAPQRAADGSLVYALLRGHVSIARLVFRGAPERRIQGVASDRAPRPDPSGQRIAFVSRRTGSPELWLARPDGSGARAITALAGVVEQPSWSPRGDRLAFVGSCGPGQRIGLCLVRDDGQALQPLSTDGASYGAPTWHPQRDEVWVASDRGGATQLWRFAASGGPGAVEATELPPGRVVQWRADGSGFVYQPRGEAHLRWRSVSGPEAGRERRIDVAATGEQLVDWQLGPEGVTTLTRSDRDRWRRVDLASGRRQALGEQALGSFPERARFALEGPDAVWVEVANTQGADLMRLR